MSKLGPYTPQQIEPRWQAYWSSNRTFAAEKLAANKPKYYILDMFPYPSGAGLHVGHPLGYIATDIVARYKRMQGFNVLHPMGFDSFGLPAEQYAIQTGQHPALTTEQNTARYLKQLAVLGLGHDPDTLTRTSDPDFYHWTQWIFLQLFDSWYNKATDKAEPIATLTAALAKGGSAAVQAVTALPEPFSAADWNAMTADQQQETLLHYRLAYLSYEMVNWCPALGTVLANEEVKDGLSERGGYPVERVRMRQWSLRITAYADRLLKGLETIEWPESVVEMQRNWIGRSAGASVKFQLVDGGEPIEVFTTRPDTIFGVTFLVVAPDHVRIDEFLKGDAAAEARAYCEKARNKSERERQTEVKTVTGAFTGTYAIHPFTGEKLPVWTSEYVLAGYGTGAIMAVPGHDERDHAFAKHFALPIVEVVKGGNVQEEAFSGKEGEMVNSHFLNGLQVKAAIERAIQEIEAKGLGKARVTYRLRDAIFSRQRYWGEPIPMVFRNGIPHPLPTDQLPLTLPAVESYKPTGAAESPLAAVTDWVYLPDGSQRETNTMPGWAGSSWYFLRYLSVGNDQQFVDPARQQYWMNVDLYVGGSEHAVGHLLYSRFWTQFLFDRGLCATEEPFRKLVNQGMIQGRSNFVYRHKTTGKYVSKGLIQLMDDYTPLHVDVNIVKDDVLDLDAFRNWREEYATAEFELEDGKYVCGWEVEKMSKSKYNVVNPEDLCAQYGADTFRLYEMFLGPLEQSKPWNTNGITGVFNFLKKFWRLFTDEQGNLAVTDEAPTAEELKYLHQTLKKTAEDIERLSFNTAVPQFMICTNELSRLGCRKRAILEPLVLALSPFAPHICEELWAALGHTTSVVKAQFPKYEEQYLVEASVEYPISINGKTRGKITLARTLDAAGVEAEVRARLEADPELAKHVTGPIKKMVVVPGRIVNVVL